MTGPLNIALIGLGGHGKTIQRAVSAVPDFRVVSVFDVVTEESREAAERFGARVAGTYEEVIGDDDVDAVVLVTPNHLHREQAEAAFRAGRHVFVEKPIANRTDDGEAIIRAAEQAGRTLMVGHNMRFAASVRRAKELLEGAAIGEVAAFDFHFSSETAHHMKPGAWRLNPDQCPLMPMMQLGIHAVDLIHFLLGAVERVAAHARSVLTRPPVQDVVTGMMRTANGIDGTYTSAYCTRITFRITISGTEGTLVVTPHTLSHATRAGTDGHGFGPEEFFDYRDRDFESYRLQMQEFASALREEREPEPDAASGLQALAVVAAMEEAIDRDEFVRVQRFDKLPAGL